MTNVIHAFSVSSVFYCFPFKGHLCSSQPVQFTKNLNLRICSFFYWSHQCVMKKCGKLCATPSTGHQRIVGQVSQEPVIECCTPLKDLEEKKKVRKCRQRNGSWGNISTQLCRKSTKAIEEMERHSRVTNKIPPWEKAVAQACDPLGGWKYKMSCFQFLSPVLDIYTWTAECQAGQVMLQRCRPIERPSFNMCCASVYK